jgi:outer membrane protein assembly factor BamB
VRYATLILAVLLVPLESRGGDWPLWRHNAQRTAASPDALPPSLSLQWVRTLPRLEPAWPDQPTLQFDAAYEPVIAGRRLFVGSSHNGSVTAYDTRTGDEVWRFFTEGPVRFSPLAWRDKLYFVSDDGCLYCLRADDGSLVWKFRGGPSDRRLLGNGRLISAWPARGAPVVVDGTIYFAAGIWPFMGIFLHALDAGTGDVRWTSDGDGSLYIKQPHNTDSFAGVAPQGPLVAIGEKLLVPGGRSVPACYDRSSGKMLYYQLGQNGKKGGGATVVADGELFFNGGGAFELETEKHLGAVGDLVVASDGVLFDARKLELRALDLQSVPTDDVAIAEIAELPPAATQSTSKNPTTTKSTAPEPAPWIRELGKAETPRLTALIKAGDRLYVGCEGRVMAITLPLPKKGRPNVVWESEIEGTAASLIAADDRLFAITTEGTLHCFGPAAANTASVEVRRHALPAAALAVADASAKKVNEILKATGVRDGYCLVCGAGQGDLACELVRRTELCVIVIEPDASLASALRNRLRAAGLGGDRIAVIVADPLKIPLPPYMASLVVADALPQESAERAASIAKLFSCLRPFGGIAVLPIPANQTDEIAARWKNKPLAGAVWKSAGESTLLVREGALPGSADWSHEHADAANTRVSKDRLVKAPLGLLWFGGSSNEPILPRHGHGPQPQVVEGRAIVEGVDLLRAMDIYTGRVLWEAKIPGIGALYDNTAHQPGANASGTNYIATPEGIYVAIGTKCLKLDPANGRQLAEFWLPTRSENGVEPKPAPLWGYLNVAGNYLIGGADPVFDAALMKTLKKSNVPGGSDDDEPKKKAAKSADAAKGITPLIEKALKVENDNYSSSGRLIVMERGTGKPLWTAAARSGFRHNAICVGGGRIYCIDRASGAELSRRKRRGEDLVYPPRLIAFDLETGKEVWSTEEDIFGTWLSYSEEHQALVEAGRNARDTLNDEPKGMRAYRGADGKPLWSSKTLTGPAMIHHDTILLQGSACDLLTGSPRLRAHPLSGELVEWTWSRNYGCNTPAASEHLLTFRSGAAGYFDLCTDGGTGNLGGFRSSCTNNLVVAGGVLCAPDYTRTCVCTYQNQTSLAMVHMPEVETWTSFGPQSPKHAVRRLGINLGAPGDRKADDGTLWLEYPSVGGASPAVPIQIKPEKPDWFRRHSSQISGEGPPWIAASGARGLRSLKITLSDTDDLTRRYTVRLHFSEPDDVQAGDRRFAIRLQEKTVVPALDVFDEAGGRHRGLVKEFRGVLVDDDLLIELIADSDAKLQASVLSGIEIQSEGW